MDHQGIKKLAKEKHCAVKDLIVLSSANDPFYVGTPQHIKDAEWFAQIWDRFGYVSGVHLRRIHYQMVSQEEPPLMPDGMVYENTKGCWQKLTTASKHARYLGLVDAWRFKDRRNPDPIINLIKNECEPYITTDELGYWEVELDMFPSPPSYSLAGFCGVEKYHVEIWIEKATMNDVLEPICQAHNVNLAPGMGEFSITAVVDLMRRIEQLNKPCRVFYISDFDPGGLSMPVAVSRKIEKFIHDSSSDFDIRVIPLALTRKQVLKYELPRTPIKDTERRGAKFEKRFGEGAVELDALEALHPGELRKIVVDAIRKYKDRTLTDRVADARAQLNEDLSEIEEEVIAEYQLDLDLLEQRYLALEEQLQEQAGALGDEVRGVYHAIQKELAERAPDINDYEIPIAEDADEIKDPLFDSERTYLDQLKRYKDFQGKYTRAVKKPAPVVDEAEQNLAIKRAIQQIETQFRKG